MEPRSVSLTEAFRFWLKLGFISFGGPTGQIAIMHHELVERRRWISENRFLHALNYCMLLPGPEATQLATYIGWMMHRTWGGIVAGGLFVLPSVFILIALSWIYMAYGNIVWVSGLFYGIKPAVVAIVLTAAHRIGSRALKNAWLWGIAAAAFVAIFALHAPFPAIVLTAAVVGFLGGRYAPERFTAGSAHAVTNKEYGQAIIDDDTPTPAHARFSWPKLWAYAAAGVAIWTIAIGGLLAAYGWDGTLTQMGWFFTKAALLTFGGAYAVLPYVYQGGVEHYGWLSATQMIDGLALGETTPGPLIMVVAFVGFVGGWTKELFGAGALAGAGAAGALVATFFTFLPSFVFILVGAPFIETTHGKLAFTAPLTAITAAVVGVVLNLAVFFAYHVLWPQGLSGLFDWFSALIGVAAFVALFRFKAGVIRVIVACAAFGLIFTLGMGKAMAETVNFDQHPPGALPSGWASGSTGGGKPRWAVEPDGTAPSQPNVLRQSGNGRFPWAVKKDAQLENGYVEVSFKPISGKEDQAGGLVWRWKDGDNYYVARANALENNVSLYHTTRGERRTIKYVDAPVAKGAWHRLRVEFSGPRIQVYLDGKRCIALDDRSISGRGAVGVWTKADSVTAFDDFTWGE